MRKKKDQARVDVKRRAAGRTGSTASSNEAVRIGAVKLMWNGTDKPSMQASVYNKRWALHPTGGTGSTFTVTHRKSGYAVKQYMSWDYAMALMAALTKQASKKWDFVKPEKANAVKAEAESIFASVKV